jgi:Transposase and inactivated derivatives
MSGTILIQRKPRKHLTAEQKLAIVQASYEPGALIAEVARQYDVGVSSLLKWRKRATEGSLMGVKEKDSVVSASEYKKLKKQNEQLQRLLGKKSLQIELLQDAIEIAREKKLISRQPLPGVDDIAND